MPKPSRIITKFKIQEIKQLSKQDKRNGDIAYTCPICTMLWSKILACQQCQNNVCRSCLEAYEKKYQYTKENMKCPFCASQKSKFIDYQKQAHSYFDTTQKNGFLDALERKKIDEQLNKQNNNHGQNKQGKELQIIKQEQPINLVTIPTNNQIQLQTETFLNNQNPASEQRNQQNRQNIQRNINQQSNVVLVQPHHQQQYNNQHTFFDQIEAVST